MQTFLSRQYRETAEGREADAILRSCVHCGFCTATCPTFLLSGNELDSPRGRIYLIKEMLEGGAVSATTQTHLDRCLTCQSCETTCPSGVQYHSLLNIGRRHVERQVGRRPVDALRRWTIRRLFSQPRLFSGLLGAARAFRPLLPRRLRRQLPAGGARPWARLDSPRRMVLLQGCVQRGLSPNTAAAASRVLARLGIQAEAQEGEGCCGALAYHLDAQVEGLDRARRQIDRLCALLDSGVEAIISSASGCGNFMKDYPRLLAEDADYAAKAARVEEHLRDLAEVLEAEDLGALRLRRSQKLAFHCPCTLQHGQRLGGVVEGLLARLNFSLSPVRDAHLCCGSAGAYSLLQPGFSRPLRAAKISALEAGQPDAIATANIGCQQHLGAATSLPVKHWIEYVDEALEPLELPTSPDGARTAYRRR